jgi:hypothetical protein
MPEQSYHGITYTDKGLMGMIKLIYNGDDYMFTISEKKVALYKIRIAKPTLMCPAPMEDEDKYPSLAGTFHFQLNSTTRSCPSKLTNTTLTDRPAKKFSTVCVFSKYLTIEFPEPWFCSGCDQKTFRGWVLIFVAVILVLGVGVWWMYHVKNRNNYKKLEKEFGD